MEGVSAFLVVSVLAGLVFRRVSRNDRAKGLGPGTPARFLCFTGRRLTTTERPQEYSPGE